MHDRIERIDNIAKRVSCAPRWQWRPGMLARDESGFYMRGKPASDSDLFPDLLDPATVGCMLATVLELYRDASGLNFARDREHRWIALVADDTSESPLFADSFAELLALLIEDAP